MVQELPAHISDETELDRFMTIPSPNLVEDMASFDGTLVILGIGGKMGFTLGVQAVRAAEAAGEKLKVIGVSRFTDKQQREKIEKAGIQTVVCDLLDRDAVDKLPDAERVVFMAGRKFGTTGYEGATWGMNTLVPGIAAERYRTSRLVAFSTGCVYPFVEASSGGSRESDDVGPVGEYANSCLGRERVLQFMGDRFNTEICIVRLNYAIDLRYGVLHDIGRAVFEGRRVDRSVPVFNAIWQGDATDQILRCFALCSNPAAVINVTGPEIVSTVKTAEAFGDLFSKPVEYTGVEQSKAYINNSGRAISLFGYPRIPMDRMIGWTAEWIQGGGRSLDKPTHFETSDGTY